MLCFLRWNNYITISEVTKFIFLLMFSMFANALNTHDSKRQKIKSYFRGKSAVLVFLTSFKSAFLLGITASSSFQNNSQLLQIFVTMGNHNFYENFHPLITSFWRREKKKKKGQIAKYWDTWKSENMGHKN